MMKKSSAGASHSSQPTVRPPRARDAADRKLLADVKKTGWHVVKVMESDDAPGWAFTVGLFKTFAQPEIVIFGLPLPTMHALLDNVGELVRGGLAVKHGLKSAAVIKGYRCEFRAVAPRWFEPLLGYASWFYGGADYPALQCAWPDREGNLPSSPSFQRALRSRQPRLWESTARRAGLEATLRSLDGP